MTVTQRTPLSERDVAHVAAAVEPLVRKIVGQELNGLGLGVGVRLVQLERRLLAAIERQGGQASC